MDRSRETNERSVQVLDLRFMGLPGAIAAYLIPHRAGAVLVECGPGTTAPALVNALSAYGYRPDQITDVLLTHIHLDHAGAAGWFARQGARIHAHRVAEEHLLDPQRLIASAARLYGELMSTLWGEILPVPRQKLVSHGDGDLLEIHGLRFRAIDTPGHADHHLAWTFDGICFSGDITGVRMAGSRHVRLPMPPPEFSPEKWRASLERLERETFDRLAPTHFGFFSDLDWHLPAARRALDEAEAWMEEAMAGEPALEQLDDQYREWMRRRSLAEGLEPESLQLYEVVNPYWMSTRGMLRYWNKHRKGRA